MTWHGRYLTSEGEPGRKGFPPSRTAELWHLYRYLSGDVYIIPKADKYILAHVRLRYIHKTSSLAL